MEVVKMFIYCDDPSHPKRVAVTNFESHPTVGWIEVFTRRGAKESGQTIRSDNKAVKGADFDDLHAAFDSGEFTYRDRFRLECRKCTKSKCAKNKAAKMRPFVWTPPVLFDALDKAAAAGYESLSLSGIAAIVERSSGA